MNHSKNIAIGGDHAGFEYKKALINTLEKQGYTVKDFGAFSLDSVDYPDFAHPVANAVEGKECDFRNLDLRKCQWRSDGCE